MAWDYKATITIDADQVSDADSADLTNFPVLISGTYDGTGSEPDLRSTGNGGHVESASGYDIYFYSDSDLTTRLDHEIQSYNATTGAINMWVRIPTLDYNNDTVIYMAYGDSSISTNPSTTDTWPSHYLGVWHLQEASGTYYDSTSNNRDSTGVTNVTYAQTGPFGLAAQFSNSGQIVGSDVGLVTGNNARTISAWIKPVSPSDYDVIWGYGVATTNQMFWYCMLAGWSLGWTQYGSGFNTGAYTINDGAWHYQSIRGPSNWEIFGDGASRGSQSISINTTLTGTWGIGDNPAEADRKYNGYIAEVRFSNTKLTDGWLITEYNNQGSPATFYAMGSEVSANNAPSTPTNTTPANSATNVSRNVTLIGSAYSDVESDAQTASQWQVATDSEFSSVVWDSGEKGAVTQLTVNSTNGTFAGALDGKDKLDPNTSYYWRVKYKD